MMVPKTTSTASRRPRPPPSRPTQFPPLPPGPPPASPPSPPPAGPRLEDVPLRSARGIWGLVLLAFTLSLLFLNLLTYTMEFVSRGRPPAPPQLSDLEVAVVVWSTLILQPLFAAPLLGYLALVRPGKNVFALLGFSLSRRTPLQIAVGLGLGLAFFLGFWLVSIVLAALHLYEESASPLALDIVRYAAENPVLIFLIPLVAGVVEEAVFRGFFLPRIGLVASSLLFALVHLSYGTLAQIVVPGLLGLVLGLAYKRWATIWIPIGAHFMLDFVQLVLFALFGEQFT